MKKKALFGGALRCAGIATAAVMSNSATADVVPALGANPNYTFNFAREANNVYTVIWDYDLNVTGGFPLPTSYAGPGGSLNAYAGPTGMGAMVSGLDPGAWGGLAGAVVQQYFTIETSRKMLFSWDFTQANYSAYGLVFEIGVGPLVTDGGEGTAGSISLVLNAGSTYAFYGRAAIDSSVAGRSAFITLTNSVPAPGALALLGIGMLGVKRRRRE